jgi:hypothetical protein
MSLDEDKTIQDYIEQVGEELSWIHAPDWVTHPNGVWKSFGVRIGESQAREGVLEPGIHVVVCGECGDACGGMSPMALWIGGELAVEA